MNTITMKHFDVHAYVKKAKELGTSEELAEFQARQIEQAIESVAYNMESKSLASRNDITDVKNDIVELRKELISVELRLIKWVLGTGVASILAITGAITAVLRFMIH